MPSSKVGSVGNLSFAQKCLGGANPCSFKDLVSASIDVTGNIKWAQLMSCKLGCLGYLKIPHDVKPEAKHKLVPFNPPHTVSFTCAVME